MTSKQALLLFVLSISLAACLHTGDYTGPYAANSPSVLVEPSFKAWIKSGATDEEEKRALGECSDELQSSEELRKSSMKVWSDAYEACMNRKGFRYYKER